MRRVVVLAILALALPIAAWADGITILNEFGSISITAGGIGSSTISSKQSELVQYNNVVAAKGQSLGYVNYSTGVLVRGTYLSPPEWVDLVASAGGREDRRFGAIHEGWRVVAASSCNQDRSVDGGR